MKRQEHYFNCEMETCGFDREGQAQYRTCGVRHRSYETCERHALCLNAGEFGEEWGEVRPGYYYPVEVGQEAPAPGGER